MDTLLRQALRIALIVGLALSMSACGGSSGEPGPVDENSTDWNQLVWNEGTWGP